MASDQILLERLRKTLDRGRSAKDEIEMELSVLAACRLLSNNSGQIIRAIVPTEYTSRITGLINEKYNLMMRVETLCAEVERLKMEAARIVTQAPTYEPQNKTPIAITASVDYLAISKRVEALLAPYFVTPSEEVRRALSQQNLWGYDFPALVSREISSYELPVPTLAKCIEMFPATKLRSTIVAAALNNAMDCIHLNFPYKTARDSILRCAKGKQRMPAWMTASLVTGRFTENIRSLAS